uniref:Ring finger and CHY zinc finger domain containing 1 n=1 Tax=Gasterosteus aculeatus aculeatus TaxID=481459 RepID=A0AAQ4QC07_GASAC
MLRLWFQGRTTEQLCLVRRKGNEEEKEESAPMSPMPRCCTGFDTRRREALSHGRIMASPAGCEHYERSCLLKAPCCGKLYVCRLCHDAKENHEMDRFKVTEVQCSECQTVQQAQQTCQQCHAQFGEYYCDICHLFDKDKKQYHCQPCGICRIGPREEYFHCVKCNLCLTEALRGNHKCVENVSRQNCPVCMEDIHTSRIGAHVLPCGHLLHKAYRCPLCMHSACEMEEYWDQIDIEISMSPMPHEYSGATVKIICNDCQTHCTVPFHVLGMKCSGCGSYNTAQDGGLIQQQPPPQQQDAENETEAEQQDAENEAETESEQQDAENEAETESERTDEPRSPAAD